MKRSILVACLAAACDPTEGGACGDGEPALQVGVGDRAFEEAPPGTEAHVVYGPQGGWHVWVALAATGLESIDDVPVHLEASLEGEPVAEDTQFVSFRCDRAERRFETWGLTLQFFGEPEEIVGHTVDVSGTLVFTDGTQLEDQTSLAVVE